MPIHPPSFLRSVAFLAGSVIWAVFASGESKAGTKRFNLDEESPKPRFTMTDRVWPAKVGAASICLWHKDRLAALSITIDDNVAVDIPWWRKQLSQRGLHATWFVITGRVDNGIAMNGTWAGFQQLRDEGNGVESHTVEHLHTERGPKDGGPWGIQWEYEESLRQLNANMTGPRVSALAYPGGKNKNLNDRKLAAKLYRAARGTSGSPNQANCIDYLNTNCMSGFNLGDPGKPWSDVRGLLDPSIYNGKSYRGWAVTLSHLLSDKGREKYDSLFAFIDQHRAELWVGLFTDVAKYGQERDTATLSVAASGPNRIEFSVTDEMDDDYFNFPLSVKVRVPDDWSAVMATQGGAAVPVSCVRHEGAAYAVVETVPDRGPVVCVKQ